MLNSTWKIYIGFTTDENDLVIVMLYFDCHKLENLSCHNLSIKSIMNFSPYFKFNIILF